MTTAEIGAIGTPTRLIEGDTKVTGNIRFIGDMQMPGMLHARFVPSQHAHAKVLGIDTAAAKALPGVFDILTAADLPDIPPVTRQKLLLARERVIFVGQPVALILAENEAVAIDAMELVVVDYEPLPAAISLDDALAPDAPLVWPDGMPGEAEEAAAHGADAGGDSELAAPERSNIAKRAGFSRGDVAAGFAAADVIIEREFTTQMVHQCPMESHGCAVQIDQMTGQVTVWSSTQAPYTVQQQVAEILGLPETDVRCIGTPVGGGFGGKGVLYQLLIALVARQVNRPIRFIMTRYEEMVAANVAPPGRMRVKLGAKLDGTFTALESDVAFNSGCYPSSPMGVAMLVMGSIYTIENVKLDAIDVVSFKPSSGAYRAPGVPQGQFCLESVVDEMADALGADPLALRMQNAVEQGDMMINGDAWPKIGMKQVLDALQAHPSWQNREATRAAGRGVGIAIGGWPGGTGPAAAACGLTRDGTISIKIGTADISGVNTAFVMMAADTFGVTPDKVKITSGDTGSEIFGPNSGGSKITYTVGPALIKAVEEVKRQTLEIVADMLEVASEDLEIVDGSVQVKGTPDTAIPLAEIAAKSTGFGAKYAPVYATGRNAQTMRSPAFSAQLAEVEIDRETGAVTVHKLVAVQDVGKALNPLTVEGQVLGGAMQGLGWALYEELAYDETGQPLTASFVDYNVPKMAQTAGEIEMVLVEVPSDTGPMGAKGVGEPSIVPTAGAVANAIHDAVGARVLDLPITPPRILAGMG